MGEHQALSFRPLKLASRQLDIGIWSPKKEVKVRVNVWEPCPHRRCLHPQSRAGPWRAGAGEGARVETEPRGGGHPERARKNSRGPSAGPHHLFRV